jgi:cysteine desulfurase / selenocysteine lyase
VDGAQSAAHLKIDLQEMGADFFCCSGHKMYGPTGIGVLCGRTELLEAMCPYQTGSGMITTVTFDETTFRNAPEKFEAGTPHIAGAVGLAAAIAYLDGIGMDTIQNTNRNCCSMRRKRWQQSRVLPYSVRQPTNPVCYHLPWTAPILMISPSYWIMKA